VQSLTIYTVYEIYVWSNQEGWAGHIPHMRDRIAHKTLVENPELRRHLRDLGVGSRIIINLPRILWNPKVRYGFQWILFRAS
jgi:hypothetical protein